MCKVCGLLLCGLSDACFFEKWVNIYLILAHVFATLHPCGKAAFVYHMCSTHQTEPEHDIHSSCSFWSLAAGLLPLHSLCQMLHQVVVGLSGCLWISFAKNWHRSVLALFAEVNDCHAACANHLTKTKAESDMEQEHALYAGLSWETILVDLAKAFDANSNRSRVSRQNQRT